ncbi:MAG: formylglycine-generating enzyme family protein [Bacteroidota bacterium]
MTRLNTLFLLIFWGILVHEGFSQRAQSAITNKLIWVEGGEFTMGNPVDHYLYYSQRPLHQVTIDDFYIHEHEVTNEEFLEFLKAHQEVLHPDTTDRIDSTTVGLRYKQDILIEVILSLDSDLMGGLRFQPNAAPDKQFTLIEGREQHPVTYVTWYGAKAYCRWRYRTGNLPSEAQWEYAARGGQLGLSNLYRYAGSDSLSKVGWYRENANFRFHSVGKKHPNQLGLYDMSGNVWEWVLDHWHENYVGAPANDRARIKRFAKRDHNRVLRGGAWLYRASRASITHRWSDVPDDRHAYKGFRCVCKK